MLHSQPTALERFVKNTSILLNDWQLDSKEQNSLRVENGGFMVMSADERIENIYRHLPENLARDNLVSVHYKIFLNHLRQFKEMFEKEGAAIAPGAIPPKSLYDAEKVFSSLNGLIRQGDFILEKLTSKFNAFLSHAQIKGYPDIETMKRNADEHFKEVSEQLSKVNKGKGQFIFQIHSVDSAQIANLIPNLYAFHLNMNTYWIGNTSLYGGVEVMAYFSLNPAELFSQPTYYILNNNFEVILKVNEQESKFNLRVCWYDHFEEQILIENEYTNRHYQGKIVTQIPSLYMTIPGEISDLFLFNYFMMHQVAVEWGLKAGFQNIYKQTKSILEYNRSAELGFSTVNELENDHKLMCLSLYHGIDNKDIFIHNLQGRKETTTWLDITSTKPLLFRDKRSKWPNARGLFPKPVFSPQDMMLREIQGKQRSRSIHFVKQPLHLEELNDRRALADIGRSMKIEDEDGKHILRPVLK